jgi:hypothetical protein
VEHWKDDTGLDAGGLMQATYMVGVVRDGLSRIIKLLESTGNEKDAARARAAWRALDDMKRMEET